MLDNIAYLSNGNGTFTRTVTNVIIVSDIPNELAALNAQLIDFQQGNQTPEIQTAIANYQAQIAILQVG